MFYQRNLNFGLATNKTKEKLQVFVWCVQIYAWSFQNSVIIAKNGTILTELEGIRVKLITKDQEK